MGVPIFMMVWSSRITFELQERSFSRRYIWITALRKSAPDFFSFARQLSIICCGVTWRKDTRELGDQVDHMTIYIMQATISRLRDDNCWVGFVRSRAGTLITPLRILSKDCCKSCLSIFCSMRTPRASNSNLRSFTLRSKGLSVPACLPNLPAVDRVCK